MNVKNSIKNIIMWLALAFLLASCTLDVHHPRHDTDILGVAYIEATVHYDLCYEEPYWHMPEWCDVYSNAECCTWYVDGWYEEWCDWDYDGCWEYSESY